ncbi:probable aspartyl protease At4g16563 [Impatiens glandulifera]|uniref:probable aspartyl protease At4g16563 n=1 Tax=Impatiens glandulifera TaxID=253017 RepID=UPI001FB05123|nr:probable aspartyl protease At4g16563 [Impatiens glandulifera]
MASSSSSVPTTTTTTFFVVVILLLFHFCLTNSEFMFFPLSNSMSTTQYNSTHHLLKSTAVRSSARFQQQRQQQQQVSLPLAPGSDYTISLSLGSNPAQTISLYMDTGSDVVWLPCHPFECILCEGKYNPSSISNAAPLNLSSASPVSCKSTACSAVHSSITSTSDLCAMAKCPLELIETSDCDPFSCPQFYYAYGDGSLIARLYTDGLTIPMSSPSLVLQNFTFGCAHEALGEPIGVAGFGNGLLSLPAQLANFSPQLGDQFSYCLVSHSFDADQIRRPSPLILGHDKRAVKSNSNGDEFVYTPMLDNPKYGHFYSVGLEAISVGKRRIPAPENLKVVDKQGNGGMVVDSGTTFTILPSKLYNAVAIEFTHAVGRVHKRASRIEDRTGLSPCYYFDNPTAVQIPVLTLHFMGSNKSGVVLPKINYLYVFLDGGDDGKRKRKVGCLMLMNGGDGDDEDEGGPVGTLGNYQQQGFEVVYDLKKRRVGFARRECSSLWDSLHQN